MSLRFIPILSLKKEGKKHEESKVFAEFLARKVNLLNQKLDRNFV